jgi:hypothetical protein
MGLHCENVNMEHELHVARFFKLQKIQNLNFEKIQKKYQSVVYDLFYQCVKFYYKISYILSSAKITKSRSGNKISNLGTCSNFCPFCLFY